MATDPSSSCEAVLFDLDGTLADTVGLILLATAIRWSTIWERSSGRGLDRRHGAPPPGPTGGVRVDERRSAVDAGDIRLVQRTVHDEMVQPYPGVVELVESLAEDGRPIAVVTSKRREMARRTLKCCGLEQHFDLVIAATTSSAGSPIRPRCSPRSRPWQWCRLAKCCS